MNPQIEALSEIIGSCNTKCDHPFDCSHCKAFRVYDAGYRKVSDILHELDEEICSAIQKREYDVTAFSFAEIVDTVFNKVLEKYEKEEV